MKNYDRINALPPKGHRAQYGYYGAAAAAAGAAAGYAYGDQSYTYSDESCYRTVHTRRARAGTSEWSMSANDVAGVHPAP
jgi:hypothetical protein